MSVLALLSNATPTTAEALDFAVDTAKRLDTDVRALFAMPDPSGALFFASSEMSIGVGSIAVAQVQEAQDKLIAEVQALIEKTRADSGLGEEGFVFDRRVVTPEVLVPQAAVLQDAVVFPRPAASGGDALTGSFERTLLDAGLPVVLAGSTNPAGDGPVLIAWDGSPEVARAVAGHAQLIQAAGKAVIAQNGGDLKANREGEAADPARLEAWLTRRGVASQRAEFSGEVAKGLLDLSEAHNASLLVMGAYGHSRAGEFLFGGTTRSLLKAKACPPLALSH